MRIKVIVPFPMDAEGGRNRAAQVGKGDLLPGTEVEFVPVKNSARTADSAYDTVIVLGSTTMHEAYGYLKERLPCPVVNPGLWAVKLAELLVTLGVGHSKLAWPPPPEPVDEVVFTRLAGA